MTTFAERVGDFQPELFEPTAAGVLAWVETTRPRPPEEAVREHVRWLDHEGLLADDDRAQLAAAGY
jgi:hypothetical protein